MRPLYYSVKEAKSRNIGWQRCGEDIAYYSNNLPKTKIYGEKNANTTSGANVGISNSGPSTFYTMSFKTQFKYDDDEVYFAYCYPYTYSDYQEHISKIATFQNKDKVRKALLVKTLAGNDCDLLIITNFASEPQIIAERPSVILSGRVHPGESNSSYIMEGVINFLVSEDP